MAVIEIPVRGRFDLVQSIGFGFGQRDAGDGSVMRLAFCLDGYVTQVGAAVTQPAPDVLSCEVLGDADPSLVAAQVARVLSVDVDATGYDELGARDPLVGAAQSRRPGLRPPLFYSAYEALLWSVLSARRPQRQMAGVRAALARAHGRVFEVAGQQLAAVPLPADLLGVADFSGIPAPKIPRLHGIARAALDGALDTATLRALDPAAAATELQRLDGIGPFYSELVTVRALGHTDVLPVNEPMVRSVVARALGEDEPLSPDRLTEVAEAWRPWRTWVAVAMRAGSVSP
ncbi:DNA-3-methyladenine glycosylase family protein [Cellulomonas sp. ICMP 17802]|uniref:DNA-3-methyladenine glycosylase family protein n=1 Tax=Cellulomonas sp. ICMP 17802 TaxID=3239199 RepID=UPI00351B32BA